MAAAFGSAVGWLIASEAPSHASPPARWPYWLCGLMFFVGALVYMGANAHPVAASSLADRAQGLHDDLYEFIAQRRREDPHLMLLTQGGFLEPQDRRRQGHEAAAMSIIYNRETMIHYSRQFAGRASAIYYEALEAGLVGEDFRGMIEAPTNMFGLEIVAQEMGAIAQKAGDR